MRSLSVALPELEMIKNEWTNQNDLMENISAMSTIFFEKKGAVLDKYPQLGNGGHDMTFWKNGA